MKHTTMLYRAIGAALLFSPAIGVAQDEPADYLLTINAIEIKPGHEQAFRAGVGAIRDCYKENGSASTWTVWNRLQGKGNVFLAVFPDDDWAAMDADDPAGEACRTIASEQISPNIAGTSTLVAKRMPEHSGDGADDDTVVRLHYFRVDDDGAFRAAVSDLSEIIRKDETHADDSWYRVIGGGPGEADYFVVQHFADYAALDADFPSAYEVVEQAVGAEKADALWKRFGDALKDDWEYWSYQYSLIDELSLNAGEQ